MTAILRTHGTPDYPAANGQIVTEGIWSICIRRGHAAWLVDGILSPICPRCGVVYCEPDNAMLADLTVELIADRASAATR